MALPPAPNLLYFLGIKRGIYVSDNGTDSFFLQDEVQAPEKRRAQAKKLKTWVVILIGIAYALLTALFAMLMNVGGQDIIMLLSVYAYGLMGGGALLIVKMLFQKSEKNRRILSEVLEHSRAGRLITDHNDETVYSNIRFEKMLSSSAPTLDNFSELFTSGRKMRSSLNNLKKKVLSGESTRLEAEAIIDDKETFLQITAKPIQGWKNYVHWRIDDLSEQKAAEDRLIEEREKLADFTDNAPVGFFSVDENGVFTFINNVLAKWLSVDQTEIIGRGKLHDYLFDIPEDIKPYEVFENSDSHHQSGELSMVAKDGRIFKAAITHSIVPDTKAGKIRTRSVIYDLTAEQEIEAALRETQDSFERLFEEAPVGICLLARDGAIDAANASLGGMFGLKAQDIKHKLFTDYILDSDRKMVSEWIEQLFRSKQKSATIEAHLNTQAKTVVQVFGRKFRGGDSMVLHFIDLTEQKKLEQQFSQSQKMQAIGQLAGGVAHDFNNLLTAMIGFCDLLLLRHKPGDPSFTDIMQIKQNANRAANLVRQLLAFSRQQTLQPKVMDINEVLSELSHLIRRLIGARIDLSIEHKSAEPGLVKVDQGQLEQVLINLAVNARDAMPEGGALNIFTSAVTNDEEVQMNTNDLLPPGKWVRIDIEDTGTGIPKEILDRIFEPFFTTKELGAGTGLGLSTVHGIIHQTGGFLSVHTEVNTGTTFSIYLPFFERNPDDQEKNAEKETESEADLTGTAKILLVEDEDAVRSFSARALGNKGYDVIEAINGRDALDIIARDKPALELIITDVVMPEVDGPTMIEELRETYKDVKIIFMSGYTEDRLKQQFGEDFWFLPKPFTLKQLATKVKDVLDA
jgi:two-component system cell cycle sensor histidine kinase/response regulator CckA